MEADPNLGENNCAPTVRRVKTRLLNRTLAYFSSVHVMQTSTRRSSANHEASRVAFAISLTRFCPVLLRSSTEIDDTRGNKYLRIIIKPHPRTVA